jgi:DNA-binding transcriptional LysR family regulator
MNDDPDWNLYRTFLAVALEGSLSGAARNLGLTQPTVSRHIDTLEAMVGGQLFLRSQRGLVATERALDLVPLAETLASTAAAFMRAASGSASDLRGAVRISAGEVVGVEWLPPILTRIRRRNPGLILELKLSDAVDDLLSREADIALRMVEPSQGALIAKRMTPVALGLFASRDYLDLRGHPASLADLADHDLIGFDNETPFMREIGRRFPTLRRSAFALRSDSTLVHLAAVRAGFGIGLCQVALGNGDPALTRLLEDEVAMSLGLWIVMHQDLKTNARCRAVFDALVSGLSAV